MWSSTQATAAATLALIFLQCTALVLTAQEADPSLYCNITGDCTPCGEDELKHEHCLKTGYKEQLQCSTVKDPKEAYQVVLSQPGLQTAAGAMIDFTRGCSPHHKVHAEAGTSRKSSAHMSIFHFELVMLGVLCASLPVVYWRKLKQRAI